jgi:hypothetical protein
VVITSTVFDTIQLSLESLIPVVLTSTLTWTLYLQVLFPVSSLVPFLTRIQNTSAIFGAGLFTVNGVPFESPSVPVLLQILSGTQKASDLLPKGSVYELAPNKSVELTIPGGASDSPVSVRESHYRYNQLRTVVSINSTLFICTGTIFMWYAALVTRPTTSSILSSEMS